MKMKARKSKTKHVKRYTVACLNGEYKIVLRGASYVNKPLMEITSPGGNTKKLNYRDGDQLAQANQIIASSGYVLVRETLEGMPVPKLSEDCIATTEEPVPMVGDFIMPVGGDGKATHVVVEVTASVVRMRHTEYAAKFYSGWKKPTDSLPETACRLFWIIWRKANA